MDTPRSARALAFHAAKNPEVWTRKTCAWFVGDTTQDQELLALIEAWHAEMVAEVRDAIGRAAERFGCYAFARDRNAQMRWWVGATGDGMIAHQPSDRLRLQTWRRIAALAADDGPARERTIAVLGSLPAFAAEPLAAALRDVDVRVRRGAARALEKMGPRGGAAGPALSESLHRDPEVTLEAIDALGTLHHQPAWEAIVARLGDDSPLDVRVAAARALGRLDVPRAVPDLEGAMKSANPPLLRATAAAALLSYARAEQSLPVLIHTLPALGADAAPVEADVLRWLEARHAAGDTALAPVIELWLTPDATPADHARILREHHTLLAR
jgi:hypothetical protein